MKILQEIKDGQKDSWISEVVKKNNYYNYGTNKENGRKVVVVHRHLKRGRWQKLVIQ